MADSERILAVLGEAKRLAQECRRLTGRPLGITGEVAERAAMSREFNVVIERDEDGYFVASVPALPGCHSGSVFR